jgi:hypothetical protein
MADFLNRLLDRISNFLGTYPGLLPVVAILLILLNFVLQVVPGSGVWLVDSNLFLHLGLIVGLVGILLIKPLG